MTDLSRRKFLRSGAAALTASLAFGSGMHLLPTAAAEAAGPDIRGRIFKGDAPRQIWRWSHEAHSYRKLDGGRVMCGICPNRCLLSPGDRSICRSKVNRDGKLYTLVYGNPCAVHVDPIEKKPLYHFQPQSKTFSLATTGCNLRCLNCQNWEISQAKPHEVRHIELFPPEAVAAAKRASCTSLAFTYSEAITFFEYTLATARMARQAGLSNLLISNGYVNRSPLLELCRVLDAANINLKSFDDGVYRKLNGGRLQPVLNTLETLRDNGVHLEITTLVVPGYVDDEEMLKRMCSWILTRVGPDCPLHFLRFFPRYKLDRLPPTPVDTLTRFRSLALREGIHYVYIGNVPEHEGNHTYCHQCGKLLIRRQGYIITAADLVEGRCRFCGTVVPGVWQSI
jgi:pyruvate formate lyase activating enzyme